MIDPLLFPYGAPLYASVIFRVPFEDEGRQIFALLGSEQLLPLKVVLSPLAISISPLISIFLLKFSNFSLFPFFNASFCGPLDPSFLPFGVCNWSIFSKILLLAPLVCTSHSYASPCSRQEHFSFLKDRSGLLTRYCVWWRPGGPPVAGVIEASLESLFQF